ncbi:DMT family transporter [Desertibaculum subflavum]|uniref:DMT family transporter n=1 Tax=Desertibaculum subflavum TaxID=2268458 RepID=UPI000E66C0E1
MLPSNREAQNESTARLRAIGLALAGIALFGLLDMQAKVLGALYPVPEVVWARYAGHCLLMLIVLGPRHGRGLVRTRRLGVQLVRGVLLLLSTGFFFTALSYLPLAEAAAIGFVAPLLVTLLSIPMLGERVGWRRLTAVAVGFGGVLVILRPGGSLFTPAALLPLCTAVTYGLYQILTRRIGTSENPVASLFYTSLVGALAVTMVVPFVWVTPDWRHAPMFLALGVCGGLGHFLMIRALQLAPVSLIAPFGYSAIIWSLLFGWLIFGQFPDRYSLVGIAIVIGSGLYVAYRESVRLRALRAESRAD